MAKITLVTGGARSGKSRFAEGQALNAAPRAIYIATAEAFDNEMAARIAAHRARRGAEWETRAEPLALAAALVDSDAGAPRLVDCLTLWLSNLIHAGRDWADETEVLAETLLGQTAPVILVTNEVGAGIVPENALARRFRDAAGSMNQRIAAVSDEVYLVAAGCPLRLKP
ncbi:MAG: bifunctional adenosylcobinamide kinase/adenosylcobinamide-phosphate guanylyltransferase [Pseudomonadota bacterium]